MDILEIIIGIVLLIMAIFLVAAILMQSGKDKRLSGTIAGGAETFFGKSKASTMDKMLSKVTTIVAIVFAVLVLVLYVII
ncbi:MAG: preprotein translocase subunit SecG [Clostridia bacterium]|nr:preprotein translocase subunit SecG [Clostridia bacterium]